MEQALNLSFTLEIDEGNYTLFIYSAMCLRIKVKEFTGEWSNAYSVYGPTLTVGQCKVARVEY